MTSRDTYDILAYEEEKEEPMDGINIQVNTLIDAMIDSEPCLFHNKESNLMVSSSPSEDAHRQWLSWREEPTNLMAGSSPSPDAGPVAVRYVAPLRRTDDGIATDDDYDHFDDLFGTYNDRT